VAPDRLRVLYLCGWGRSGSTIIDRILGELEGFASLGEVRSLWDMDLTTHRCACGAMVAQCAVWAPALERAFPGVALDEAAAGVRQLRDQAARSRHVPFAWAHGAAGLRTLGAGQPRNAGARYTKALAALYGALSDRTGATVLVDSSKHPAEALALAETAGIELSVVHLVRDPRAVAYSWSRPPALPGALDVPPERGPASSSLWWTAWNAMIEAVLAPRLRPRYLRLRYEDVMAAPRSELGRIAELVGASGDQLPFVGEWEVSLGPSHAVAGNPNRGRTGTVTLAEDGAWREEMRPRDRVLATAPAVALLPHYRYPIRTGHGATSVPLAPSRA
jgi:Sulfotransferase family